MVSESSKTQGNVPSRDTIAVVIESSTALRRNREAFNVDTRKKHREQRLDDEESPVNLDGIKRRSSINCDVVKHLGVPSLESPNLRRGDQKGTIVESQGDPKVIHNEVRKEKDEQTPNRATKLSMARGRFRLPFTLWQFLWLCLFLCHFSQTDGRVGLSTASSLLFSSLFSSLFFSLFSSLFSFLFSSLLFSSFSALCRSLGCSAEKQMSPWNVDAVRVKGVVFPPIIA